MKTLFQLLDKLDIPYNKIARTNELEISNITLDSRNADCEKIFTAIKGFQTDGHNFIINAFNAGCRNFLVEDASKIPSEICSESNIAQTQNIRRVFGMLARCINDCPDESLKLFGITGTKGKTTVSTLLHHILDYKQNTAIFTTVRFATPQTNADSEKTTMEADKLQYYLQQTKLGGWNQAVVEVSSHAVTLSRVENINWDCGIFTSFSRDHLDLYGTMEAYFQAKLDFFRALNVSNKKNKIAVINIDDEKGFDVCNVIDKNTVKLFTVSMKDKRADYFIAKSCYTASGTQLTIIKNAKEEINLFIGLKGEVNIINTGLAVCAAIEAGKMTKEEVIEAAKDFGGVPGRFEMVMTSPFCVMVDYAHTPQSIEKLLQEARKISSGKIILVFGCTGDRDKEKRPIMGKIAAENADYSILTNDDLYTENQEDIMKMLEAGFIEAGKHINENYEIIYDRKTAIETAMKKAEPNDIVLLAGMGHQKYQILNTGKVAHNDAQTVRELKKKFNY
jgi:UDP-N-acetylmuramyl-tripeptide synthetase